MPGASRRRNRRHAGFTLVEMTLVLAIMAILAGIAVPRFASALANHRAESAAARIVADLELAARLARTASTDQVVAFDVGLNRYCLKGVPNLDHPERDYEIYLADEPYGATLVSADFGGDGEVSFDMYGLPDTGGKLTLSVGDCVQKISLVAETGIASLN